MFGYISTLFKRKKVSKLDAGKLSNSN